MNQDVTQEPNVIAPSFPQAYKRSGTNYAIQFICFGAIIIGVITVLWLLLVLLDKGVDSFVQNVAQFIFFGIYPLVMGPILLRQARREDIIFSDGKLFQMLSGVMVAWIGLMAPLKGLHGALVKTPKFTTTFAMNAILGISVGAAAFIFGLVWFKKALSTSKKVMLEQPERRDPDDAIHTWFVEQTGVSKTKWRLSFYSDVIQLEDVGKNELFEVPKSGAEGNIVLYSLGSNEAWMNIWGPKYVKIRLDQSQQAIVREWIGSPTLKDLKDSLNLWNLLCAAIVLFFPLTSTIAWPGLGPATNEKIMLILKGLIAFWAIGIALTTHYWPQRIVYLFIGGLITFLSILLSADIFLSPTITAFDWAPKMLLFLGAVAYILKNYRRFADVQYTRDKTADMSGHVIFTLIIAITVLVYVVLKFV